ncbi:MAG: hypothetical protein K6E20_01390 [Acholeplasmatales bacterium]|nr:hypothetical protein [Acholeplasmatales bacterium]
MVELFEQDMISLDRQSSKGNQLKWKNGDIWYKTDSVGYEGLSEYIISHLLKFSNLKEDEYVIYNPQQIKYKKQIYNGVSSNNFLNGGFKVITLERLFKNYYGKSLHSAIWEIKDHEERLKFLVEQVEKITKIKNFGKYMNKVLTIDGFFLNEDRHTHNIAVLIDDKDNYKLCPIFDNGASLLSDTKMDYPLGEDIYKLIEGVKGKTFSFDLEEQMLLSDKLYGQNIVFNFNHKDVEDLFECEELKIYSSLEKDRVKKIIFEQMRKYKYLF